MPYMLIAVESSMDDITLYDPSIYSDYESGKTAAQLWITDTLSQRLAEDNQNQDDIDDELDDLRQKFFDINDADRKFTLSIWTSVASFGFAVSVIPVSA